MTLSRQYSIEDLQYPCPARLKQTYKNTKHKLSGWVVLARALRLDCEEEWVNEKKIRKGVRYK